MKTLERKLNIHADLDIDVFISMDVYPDDVTHKLVRAASGVLGLSAEELQRLGSMHLSRHVEQPFQIHGVEACP